jgi:hypothetical protein
MPYLDLSYDRHGFSFNDQGHINSTITLKTTYIPHLPFKPVISLSISVASPGLVLKPFNSSNFFKSFDFAASSAACLIIPHLTHMSTFSADVELVLLGMKTEASLGLPAASKALKNGSQPIGDLRVVEMVSISDHDRAATRARSLETRC